MKAYPDSVSRVRPPKTTIPKTLAALPSSQYATALELVSGNDLDRVFALSLLDKDDDVEIDWVVAESRVAVVFFLLLLPLKKRLVTE